METELVLLEVTLERTRGGVRNRAGAYFSARCTLGWWKLEKELLEVTLERQVVLSQQRVQCIKQVEAGNGPEGATWAK